MIKSMEAIKYLFKNKHFNDKIKFIDLNIILYIASTRYIGKYNEKLIEEEFVASIFGPVVYGLYHKVGKQTTIINYKSCFLDRFYSYQDISEDDEYINERDILDEITKLHFSYLKKGKNLSSRGLAWNKRYVHKKKEDEKKGFIDRFIDIIFSMDSDLDNLYIEGEHISFADILEEYKNS